MVRFPNLPYKEFISAGTVAILDFFSLFGAHKAKMQGNEGPRKEMKAKMQWNEGPEC